MIITEYNSKSLKMTHYKTTFIHMYAVLLLVTITDWSICYEYWVRFYVPLQTKQLILKTFFTANLSAFYCKNEIQHNKMKQYKTKWTNLTKKHTICKLDTNYTVSQKNAHLFTFMITSSDVGRFTQFFHWPTRQEICNKVPITWNMYSNNNKSQGSVATHLRCGGLASLQSNYRSVCWWTKI